LIDLFEYELCILIFSTPFVWNISHSKKNSARRYHIFTWIFKYSICNSVRF
jgi:hypothetical protein